MFNPSELEGEVDHAFFDSDCDSSSGHGRKKVEEDLKANKKSSAVPERSNVKCATTEKGDTVPSSWKSGRHLNELKINNGRRHRKKGTSKRPSLLSTSFTTHKVGTDSSDSDEHFTENFERPRVSLLGLLAGSRDVDGKDPSSKSLVTEEEPRAFFDSSQRTNRHPLKIHAQSLNSENSLQSSTENSADADLDSNSSNSSRSSVESPTHPKDSKVHLSPKVRRTTMTSSISQQGQTTPAGESDYSMTDVSPLSSPHSSPHHSMDLNEEEPKECPYEGEQESVPSSGLSNIHEENSSREMNESFFRLGSQLGDKLVVNCPGARNRKNYSFTNEEVKRIDQENQRLLQELSRLSLGCGINSEILNCPVPNPSPLIRLSHSARNRQREQKRIERDNLTFLKRLESVKPTPGLRRSEQLADYQRHARFCGVPSYPISTSASRKESLRSRTSSDPRPVGSRAASTPSVSNAIPASRPKKNSAARPAWC